MKRSEVLPIFYVVAGRVFMRSDDGWLDLGTEEEVLPLDPIARLQLAKQRLQEPRFHQIPKWLN